jgi:CubicO group peptidase (beta-lactamase class C family)
MGLLLMGSLLMGVLLTLRADTWVAPPTDREEGEEGPRPLSKAWVDALDGMMSELHERGWFSGAVILSRGGEPVYEGGWGWANLEEEVRFFPDTPVDGGSIAKTFAAATLWMLVEEGRVSLDDPVVDRLPVYPHPGTTLRHLLSHSGGLPDYPAFDSLLDPVITTRRMLEHLEGSEPAFPPGSRFRYCNLCFDAVATVVEEVTGTSWPDLLRERILIPLSMDSAFVRPALLIDLPERRALSYRTGPDGLHLHDVFDREGFYGGSNLYLSARDLQRWSDAWFLQPVLGPEARAAGSALATVGHPPTPTGLDLLNWYGDGQGGMHYTGYHQGFYVMAWRNPRTGLSVVHVSNSGIPQEVVPLLTRALIAALEGRAFTVPERPSWSPIPDGPQRSLLTGPWIMASGRSEVILQGAGGDSAPGGIFRIRTSDGAEYDAFPAGEGVLYVPGLDWWLGFSGLGGEGEVKLHLEAVSHSDTGRLRW